MPWVSWMMNSSGLGRTRSLKDQLKCEVLITLIIIEAQTVKLKKYQNFEQTLENLNRF